MSFALRSIVAVALAASVGHAAAATDGAAAAPDAPLYLFAWPADAARPAPRGGTTKGPPVALDHRPSSAWLALQAPGLAPRERDRRAILAMAGAYRVTFDFVEVASFGPQRPTFAPYQSWSTEKVYVDADRPDFVALVHILEMRIVGADGRLSDPIVTKHWRQEWTYEPTTIVEYGGGDRWSLRSVGAGERRGAWRQTVFQVDESPRYAGIGRWEHNAGFSTWISNDTWRPLPRREWTVRRDYQVLAGTNRHTIGPTGWVQEENNLKTVVTPARTIDPTLPYVGREYGVARYERVVDGSAEGTADGTADFAEADRYFRTTRAFWDGVKETWDADFARERTITLKGQPDQKGWFAPLFDEAERIEAGDESGGTSAADARLVRTTLDGMRVRPD